MLQGATAPWGRLSSAPFYTRSSPCAVGRPTVYDLRIPVLSGGQQERRTRSYRSVLSSQGQVKLSRQYKTRRHVRRNRAAHAGRGGTKARTLRFWRVPMDVIRAFLHEKTLGAPDCVRERVCRRGNGALHASRRRQRSRGATEAPRPEAWEKWAPAAGASRPPQARVAQHPGATGARGGSALSRRTEAAESRSGHTRALPG